MAIAVVVRISIGDGDQSDSVIQDVKQFAKIKQKNAQKTIIENSTNVKVRTSDTDLAVNILLLLQVLVAILVSLEILQNSRITNSINSSVNSVRLYK